MQLDDAEMLRRYTWQSGVSRHKMNLGICSSLPKRSLYGLLRAEQSQFGMLLLGV
jgi:hypothetical protein